MNFSIPALLFLIIVVFVIIYMVHKEGKSHKKSYSNKEYFFKILNKSGNFFFWLTLIMIIISIIEVLLIPTIYGYHETKTFYANGGLCNFGSTEVPEVICRDFSLSNFLEFILNIAPFYLTFSLIFIPFGILWKITSLGSPGNSGINISFFIELFIGVLWILAVFSVLYYLFGFFKKIIKNFSKNH